jgi:hypothetical protein
LGPGHIDEGMEKTHSTMPGDSCFNHIAAAIFIENTPGHIAGGIVETRIINRSPVKNVFKVHIVLV